MKSTVRFCSSEGKVIDFPGTFKFLGKGVYKGIPNHVIKIPLIQSFITYLLSACNVPGIVLGTEDITTNKINMLCVSMEFTYNVTVT